MRLKGIAFALVMAAAAEPASAATIVIFTDPMTFERTTVVYNTKGPDRAFMCMAPPADSNCVAVPLKKRR